MDIQFEAQVGRGGWVDQYYPQDIQTIAFLCTQHNRGTIHSSSQLKFMMRHLLATFSNQLNVISLCNAHALLIFLVYFHAYAKYDETRYVHDMIQL